MSIEVHAANRLETHAHWLAARLREDPLDPFETERIVVPHPTLGRWLVLELARELGVAANVSIELPAQFAWSIMRDALKTLPTDTPFAPERLRWRIYEQVAGLSGPGTKPVRDYLRDGDPRKRFELADRLARVYDRCLLYRPEWIREWESGETPHWQARLWHRLTRGVTEPSHWVAAIDAFSKLVRDHGFESRDWPRRVSFFGISVLSPSYLDLLRHAGEHMDIDLYLLSPCKEYWSDIATRREARRRADPHAPADEYFTEGNDLLAAWGKPGRHLQTLLLEAELATGTSLEHYDPPYGDKALAAVQRDILNLRLASEAKKESPATWPLDDDDSIQIHVCHSAMREAEVLHDRLLGLFDTHDDIQPADVLVLTPNIVEYAPAIEAVFAAADVIPFNIARPRASATRAVQAFLDLLALPDSRYGSEAVMAPLESAAVRDRFRIAEHHLSTLREWISEAGIRWGIDAVHREEEGLPAFSGHSWRQGLDRLLLGYAMEGDAILYRDRAPLSPDSPGFSADHELLGRFVEYCEGAIELRPLKDDTRSATAWTTALHAVVDRFFAADWQNAAESTTVRRLIDGLATECEVGADIPFAILRNVLEASATSISRPAARLADGITVTSLSLGQPFPSKVVCTVGMNDRGFPRRGSSSSFDLVDVDDPRTGDRNDRDEDRFAFLEALLAARRCFLVTYTGRNLRDDKGIPPSVVVDDLREYLAKRFATDFETVHPLQPFSRRYFEPHGRLWSYSEAMLDAARAVSGRSETRHVRERFVAPVAPEPREKRVELDELTRFFGNPTRWFMRERLGLRLEVDEVSLEEDEPFELDGLQKWLLKSEILELVDGGTPFETIRQLTVSRGRLPNGATGNLAYQAAHTDVMKFRKALGEYKRELAAPHQDIALDSDGFRLTGSLSRVDAETNRMLFSRIGSIREKDRIEAWLKLLAWVAQNGEAGEAHLLCLASDGVKKEILCIAGRENACSQLGCWLGAWWQGTEEMLAFSPPASMAYARALTKSRDPDAAWNAAMKQWHDEHSYDELLNPYVSLAYDGNDPFAEEAFATLAERLLSPLFEPPN